MASLPPLAQLADHLVDGGLAAFIEGHRSAGKSWDWIARELWDLTDKQVDTSGVTVQGWAKRLEEAVA